MKSGNRYPEARGWQRAGHLLLGWGSVGAVYAACAHATDGPTALRAGAFDQLVSYQPHAIWAYLSFFVLVPYAFAAVDYWRLRWLERALQACALLAGIVYLYFPTTVPAAPPWDGGGLAGTALRWLLAVDTASNCLPSLHAAVTVLCVWALQNPRRRLRSLLVLAWGILVCWSVLALRRHLAIDLAAGVVLGAIAGTVRKTDKWWWQ
jgi:membrane-associated phospholipid phosphatase